MSGHGKPNTLDLNTVYGFLAAETDEQGRSFLASAGISCLVGYSRVRHLNEDSCH